MPKSFHIALNTFAKASSFWLNQLTTPKSLFPTLAFTPKRGREARGIIDFGRSKSVASVRGASRNHVLQGVSETEG